jgi:hypothetical protein
MHLRLEPCFASELVAAGQEAIELTSFVSFTSCIGLDHRSCGYV